MPFATVVLTLLALVNDQPRVETRDGKRTITNAPAVSAKTTNVLIVGNSLTYFNEMPWLLGEMAASKNVDPPLRVVFSGRSGLTLEQHWKRGQARRTIEQQRWDYVVLQAQSTEAVRTPQSFAEHARKFDEVIRKSGARTVIVETWAPRTHDYPQRDFRAKYEAIARRLNARLAPVGAAWQELQNRGITLFDGGGLHSNVAGSYLYASVLFAVVYGRSAAGAVHTFDVDFDIREFYRQSLEEDRIDAATAAAIHAAAWRAVQGVRPKV
jgi:hypothetical protein